jgi:hypothetical protein
MSWDLVLLALMAGAANWAFRALPVLLMRGEARPGGITARFLAATGPAAIATLFVASVLPQLWPVPRDLLPLVAGVLATLAGFWPRRSVVAGTLIGALGYSMAFWMAGMAV